MECITTQRCFITEQLDKFNGGGKCMTPDEEEYFYLSA